MQPYQHHKLLVLQQEGHMVNSVIIGISKIEFFNFSGIEKLKQN